MAEAYLGEIRIFAGGYAPEGWVLCNGQLLPVSEYEALYSLLGALYGGDGRTNFAVPNLQCVLAMGRGQGGGSNHNYQLGQMVGKYSVQLGASEVGAHSHSMGVAAEVNSLAPGNLAYAPLPAPWLPYVQTSASQFALAPMDPATVSVAGPGQPHSNIMPVLALSYIMCASNGLYPQQ